MLFAPLWPHIELIELLAVVQCAILFVILIEMLGFASEMQLINFVNGTHMRIYSYEGLKCGKSLTKLCTVCL